jgi:hypothetical protein
MYTMIITGQSSMLHVADLERLPKGWGLCVLHWELYSESVLHEIETMIIPVLLCSYSIFWVKLEDHACTCDRSTCSGCLGRKKFGLIRTIMAITPSSG